MISTRDLIRTRRDGGTHSRADLDDLARGAADGTVPDYALAAWLMAAYLNPLTKAETTDLTLAMAHSGERVDLTGLSKPWLDKHSTGGVGDKTTIVLLPLLAACGLTVVKMSGRGLGITGGTVDKLESIPGFRTDLSVEEMKAQAGRIGLALTGQTPRLAPADGRLYALRDATETVASIPLIAASILSKKIAGGADTVILDVKCGAGAFMTDLAQARELKSWLEEIGAGCGLKVAARITDMDQPLGYAIGNRIEVEEALLVLGMDGDLSMRKQRPPLPVWRFRALCIEYAVLALTTGGVCDEEAARTRVAAALTDGSALSKAREWIFAQGATVPWTRPERPRSNGRPPYLAYWDILDPLGLGRPELPGTLVTAERDGWVARVDAGIVGETVLALGGGRAQKGDAVDHEVGVQILRTVGERVEEGGRYGNALARVVARTPEAAEAAAAKLREAITLSEEPVEERPLFLA